MLLATACVGVYFGYQWYIEQEHQDFLRNQEECRRIERELKAYYDSLEAVEVARKDSMAREVALPSGSSSTPSSYSHSSNNSYDEEDVKEHPGTSPDDPMFGFDYWDDEDDAYEMDRNQSDAYPDDW